MRDSFARRSLPSIRASDPVQETRACLRLMAAHLVACLKAEFKSDGYVLLDWPNYANIGDRAIHIAELFLLGELCGARCVYSANVRDFDAETLKKVPPEIPILFQGGGNLGDLWPRHQAFREQVIGQFPERRFILLPQSMHYADSGSLDRTKRAFRAHANLVIFLRDWRSFDLAAEHFGEHRVRLAPDMVIALAGIMPRLLRAHPAKPGVELLHLFRRDKEQSARRPALPPDARVSDWVTLEPGWEPARKVPGAATLAAAAGLASALEAPGGRGSWRQFLLGLRQILEAERVITDRLHGHILAQLAGRPNVLYANDYHKNRAFFETWMEGLSLCRFEE